MKRAILCVLVLQLLCSGCAQTQEDPFRVETVVLIPADPTKAPAEESTEAPAEEPTQPVTEAPAELPAEPEATTTPETAPSSKSTGAGGKTSSSGKSQSSAVQKPKETDPPITDQITAMPPALLPEDSGYNPATYSVGELEYELLLELNRYRLEEGLSELTINERLCGVAYIRAQEVTVVWSHTRPDGRGYTSVLTDYGFENDTTAELLVRGFPDCDAAYYAAKWMSYKTSRKDLCNADYTTAGIGVFVQGEIIFVACLLTK